MNENQNKPQINSNNGQVLQIQKSEMFAGPVPHPEIIEKYEKIYPGAAKIIFGEWEKQVKHRHHIEKGVVWTDNIKSILGVIFGFITELSAVGGGIYIAINGIVWFGVLLVITGFVMLGTAFITSRKGKDK